LEGERNMTGWKRLLKGFSAVSLGTAVLAVPGGIGFDVSSGKAGQSGAYEAVDSCAVPSEAAGKKEQTMIENGTQRRPTAVIPPLDAAVPKRSETATFALG
jgi:hypothetical protein